MIPRLYTDRQRVSIFFDSRKYDLNSTIVSRSNDNDVFVTNSMPSIFKLTRNSLFWKKSWLYNVFPLAEFFFKREERFSRQNEPILLSLMAFSRNDIARYLFVVCAELYSCFSRFIWKDNGIYSKMISFFNPR